MKQFACGDVVPGCDAQFEAEDDAALFGQIGAHAAADHGMTELPDSLIEQVTAHLRVVQ